MNLNNLLILAALQGAAELLAVSSSAHVIVAQKLMGLDQTSPQMTCLQVMLLTGTMFAEIVHYAAAWKIGYFSSWSRLRQRAVQIAIATAITVVVGLARWS